MSEAGKSRVVQPFCGTVLITVATWLVSGQVLWIFEIRLLLSYFFCFISFGSQKMKNVCGPLTLHQRSHRCGFGLEPILCSFWGCKLWTHSTKSIHECTLFKCKNISVLVISLKCHIVGVNVLGTLYICWLQDLWSAFRLKIGDTWLVICYVLLAFPFF